MIKFLNITTGNIDVEDIMNIINNYIILDDDNEISNSLSKVNKDVILKNIRENLIQASISYNLQEPAIVSSGKFKMVKKLIKRIIRKTIYWYISDINRQQILLNANMVRALNGELQLTELLLEENKALKMKLKKEYENEYQQKLNIKERKLKNDKWYVKFENVFRGSEEEILERNKKYIEYFKGKNNVLDIGCGRGELLSLLKKEKIHSIGIDTNQEMINICKQKELNVICEDGINYLNNLTSAVDGIFMGQVIEHLSFDAQKILLELCYEKLTADGILIIETVNPLTLGIFCYGFYIDPTHTTPVHPAYLRFLVESLGFYTEPINFINPFPKTYQLTTEDIKEENKKCINKLNEQLYGAQDYYLVCRK